MEMSPYSGILGIKMFGKQPFFLILKLITQTYTLLSLAIVHYFCTASDTKWSCRNSEIFLNTLPSAKGQSNRCAAPNSCYWWKKCYFFKKITFF